VSHSPSASDLSFDTATQLHPRADASIFDVDIHPRWTVGNKPNGGILLALLGRAAAQSLDSDSANAPEAVSATVTYLGAPALSAAEVRTSILRRGRTVTHVRAVLFQSGRDLVDAVFVMSTLSRCIAPRYSDISPLRIPDPDHCVRLPPQMPDGVAVGILETTDLRLDPVTVPFAPAPPAELGPVPELRGWVRFVDGREPDPLSLLYFVDAIPPATLLIGSTGWVPTLSLAVYVRARPAPGWLGIRLTAHHVTAGMVDESCTLWDSQNQVVAQATQLARLRFPDDVR
jgi:hypothetical protein